MVILGVTFESFLLIQQPYILRRKKNTPRPNSPSSVFICLSDPLHLHPRVALEPLESLEPSSPEGDRSLAGKPFCLYRLCLVIPRDVGDNGSAS